MGTKQQVAKAQAEVMQAFAEGAQIEMRNRSVQGWAPCREPIWNWAGWEYRVAPKKKKKKTVYVNLVTADGAFLAENARWFDNKDNAEEHAEEYAPQELLARCVPITIEVEE